LRFHISVPIWLLLAVILATLALVGCSSKPLIYDVTVQPGVISPNADGVADVARIEYRLSRNAMVRVFLRDQQGNEHVFRNNVSRPKGDYEALFSGIIGGLLLPDGSYSLVLEAVADDGQRLSVDEPLTIDGGDLEHIKIENLVIYPTTFTPNRDGINDRVKIAYYLTEEAAKVQVYVLDAEGNKHPVPEDKIRPVGQVGNHEHDYDAGIDLGATPPPDGTYTVVVEAEDAVGNRDVAQGQLTIVDGGVPQVEIVNRTAVWSASIVPLGGTLSFTCTVRNIGRVGVRTKGPEPGTLYTTSENFNAKEFYEEPGIFRVGLDYEGNSSGRVYPFRWQLGRDEELTEVDGQKYLMPGQIVTVAGHLQIVDEPITTSPYYWLGMIHEQVWIVEDRVEPVPVNIGF
jgi:hypothetical protein